MVLELPLLGDLITKAARFLFSVLVASVVAVLWRKICGLLVHLLRIRAQQGCFPLWMTSLSLYIFHLHPPPTPSRWAKGKDGSACSANWFSACLDLFRFISSHIILTAFGWWLQLQRYNISFSHRSSSSLQPPAR